MRANLGIFFIENISLCLESGNKIVYFKVNFVFLQAKEQKYALSLTISFSESIITDEIHKIYN